MSNSRTVDIVRVPLGERSYDILIGNGILPIVGPLLEERGLPKQTVIISDRNVAPRYLGPVEQSLKRSGCTVLRVIIPAGEKEKNLQRAGSIYTTLLRHRISRRSTILALGGGVVGDLAGFVAATYQRGVSFVQIPTTLLAQVDSSVGGKVGVNHPLGKNMVGAFYQPSFVLADAAVLRTLPRRELICGLGEVLKYGIILDERFFSYTRTFLPRALRGDRSVLQAMVRECCSMKAFVVSGDERESGLRAILNFGHTVGHALEKAGRFSVLKHGEAVLWGMMAETRAAQSMRILPERDAREIMTLLSRIPLPPMPRPAFRSLVATMRLDKKAIEGKIMCVLPTRIGAVNAPAPVDESVIGRVLQQMRRYKL
ncbi:MAG: 3-dehydroquinate synthase [Ignavibacteriales bacterium]|nr:3-dehydroquinate synthase [Ignavibacteriales bacterium]